jgi:hypothetical protein
MKPRGDRGVEKAVHPSVPQLHECLAVDFVQRRSGTGAQRREDVPHYWDKRSRRQPVESGEPLREQGPKASVRDHHPLQQDGGQLGDALREPRVPIAGPVEGSALLARSGQTWMGTAVERSVGEDSRRERAAPTRGSDRAVLAEARPARLAHSWRLSVSLADARSALSSSLRIRALQDNAATCNETGQWGSGECVKAKKTTYSAALQGNGSDQK